MRISTIAILSITALLSVLLLSCSKRSNDIGICIKGDQIKLFGYSNCTYTIGNKIEFKNTIDTTGIYLEIKKEILKSVTISGESKYELSNGVNIGTTKKRIIKLMGKPINDEITLSKGSMPIGIIDVFAYDKTTIFFDENELAKSISIGNINY